MPSRPRGLNAGVAHAAARMSIPADSIRHVFPALAITLWFSFFFTAICIFFAKIFAYPDFLL